MAFNILKKKIPVDLSPRKTSRDATTTESNTVATQSWVKSLLETFYNWTSSFKTNGLQVGGPLQAETIQSTTMVADEMKTAKLTLLDQNGKPMVLTIGADGKLATEYYYENVYMYPGTDLDIRTFFYTMGKTIVDNFNYQTPEMVMEKFIAFTDTDTTDYNGTTCYKLCSSDGQDSLIGRTMLISCPQNKLISNLVICDEDMNPKTKISLPDDVLVRKLTINMPYFTTTKTSAFGVEQEVVQFVELPYGYVQEATTNTPPLPVIDPMHLRPDIFDDNPPLPVIDPMHLRPDIFDDNPPPPPQESRIGMPGASIEDCVCGKSFGGHVSSNTAESIVGGEESGVKYSAFVTDTYSNIILKRSDFETNKKQFLVVETQDA